MRSIHSCQSISKGKTRKDIMAIYKHLEIIPDYLNVHIQRVRKYVNSYNKVNTPKLEFKVRQVNLSKLK